MAKRWNVYQGEQLMGPMTAPEIRRALRDGTLDPFDLVSLEGTDRKVELVEVDEIFQEHTQPDLKAVSEPLGQAVQPSQHDRTRAANQFEKPGKLSFPPESTLSRGSSAPSFPADGTRTNGRPMAKSEMTNVTHLPKRIRSNTVTDKRKDKKFYLIDEKKRVLGPLTAVEVQSLFYRGILNKHVKVQKTGSDSRIPVRQFISAYSGKRMKALADQGGGKGINGTLTHPSTKVLNELFQLINSKKLAETRVKIGPSLGLIILGIGLGLAVYLIFDWRQMQDDEAQKRRPPRPSLIQSDTGSEGSQSEAENPSVVRPTNRMPDQPGSSGAARPAPVIRSTPAVVAEKPATTKVRRQSSPAAASPPAKTTRPTRSSPVVPAPAPAVPVARPIAPAASPARPTTVARVEPGPIAQAAALAGSVINVGPVSFSQADLQSCELKCELSFRDAQGGQLTAVFFKGAYFDQLLAKGRSPVTLTGSSKLENGKLVLFIQDIR